MTNFLSVITVGLLMDVYNMLNGGNVIISMDRKCKRVVGSGLPLG